MWCYVWLSWYQGWGEYYSGTRLAQNDKHECTKNIVLEYYSSTDYPVLVLVCSVLAPALHDTKVSLKRTGLWPLRSGNQLSGITTESLIGDIKLLYYTDCPLTFSHVIQTLNSWCQSYEIRLIDINGDRRWDVLKTRLPRKFLAVTLVPSDT